MQSSFAGTWPDRPQNKPSDFLLAWLACKEPYFFFFPDLPKPPYRLRQTWCYLGKHFIQALFKIFLKIFLMFTIFKVFAKLVAILLLFHDLVFWLQSMWDLSSVTRDWTHIPHSGRSLNSWTTWSLCRSFDKGLLHLLSSEIKTSLA